ncbi:unnamed protein product [Allacma fusca]|uniref:Secreted protein n=1 Tax=Allacma fusca TaxID=39272 RepID=A0A8J2JY37_9HEXA|nr:unnamed protein product [Allacma fusca]
MKVSFHCILIVTIFSDFTLGEDKINCTSETKSGEICCGGDVYNKAENIWPDESCDVEPKNETLTFADSAWLAYHCNDLFWKAITSPINISKIPGDEEEYAKIQTMKLYHRQYMHAVEQVCTVEVANATSEIPNFNSVS